MDYNLNFLFSAKVQGNMCPGIPILPNTNERKFAINELSLHFVNEPIDVHTFFNFLEVFLIRF